MRSGLRNMLAVLLCVVMSLSVFAGCGDSGQEAATEKEETEIGQIAASEKNTEEGDTGTSDGQGFSFADVSKTDRFLPFYGIYNVASECGFSSYERAEEISIDEELAGIEEAARVLENELQSGDLSQVELNLTSGEMYHLWDDELNSIWSRLKETLDEAEMEDLLIEQREWIAYKESEVEAEGAEYEGGSMRPLVENDLAAELTKQRVYELAELLR